jgi:hypothetical protein
MVDKDHRRENLLADLRSLASLAKERSSGYTICR